MPARASLLSLLLLALVAALVGFARPAAAAIGPPWCGTPEPDAAEALPSTGTSFPHIPTYAIGCTLADIQSRSLDGRMSLEVHGSSATGRPLYKVVINQLKTAKQKSAFTHWATLRREALTNPAAAQRQLRAWRDDVKVPIFIQGAIHGNEYEGVDANMRTIERLATTPYGTDPGVDAVLDGAVVVFNVIQNPDGRVAGTRANGNGFDLNRDFLTQSQSETKASVRIMQEWLPPETLDLHGYVTPTLIEATTKPHNPGIDYDLWLKWNQSRIDANEAAMNAVNMNVTRPVNDWCSDGSVSVQGAICPDGQPAGPAVAESWDDWGPFYTPMYSQLVGLNGSTVEMCSSTNTGTNPLNRCYLNADPDPAKNPIGRNASLLAQLTVSWSTLLFDTANRNDLLNDQLEIYRRGVAGEARPPCCPAPFDRENNWMHEFPSAYVIPLGAGQRSDAEANRLVDWLLFNGIEVRQLRFDSVILGQDVAAGSYVVDMAQAHRGLAETSLGIGVDVSSRIGILYAPPAAWSHGYLWGADTLQVPNGVPFTAKTTQPIAKTVVLGGGVESGPADYYALEIDSATAVRTLNALLQGGLTAKLATAPFTSGGASFPAGTVLFDDATAGVIGPAAKNAGLTLRRVASAPASAGGRRPLAADRGVHERPRPERLVAAEPRLHRRPGRHDGAERRRPTRSRATTSSSAPPTTRRTRRPMPPRGRGWRRSSPPAAATSAAARRARRSSRTAALRRASPPPRAAATAAAASSSGTTRAAPRARSRVRTRPGTRPSSTRRPGSRAFRPAGRSTPTCRSRASSPRGSG